MYLRLAASLWAFGALLMPRLRARPEILASFWFRYLFAPLIGVPVGLVLMGIAGVIFVPAAVSSLLFGWLAPSLNARIQHSIAAILYFGFLFTIEWLHGTKVYYTGDLPLNTQESALVISNHLTGCDPWFVFAVASRASRLAAIRTFVKDSLKWMGPFGWWGYFAGFILLKRNWAEDAGRLHATFARIVQTSDVPLWLITYLEGTRITSKKKAESDKFGIENKLKPLKHLLYPRTKGFISTLSEANPVFDAVYDVTVAHTKGQPLPHIWPFFTGTYADSIHIHITRHPISGFNVQDPASLKAWAFDQWYAKDNLLSYFDKYGHFPTTADAEARLTPCTPNPPLPWSWSSFFSNFWSPWTRRDPKKRR